MTDDRLITVAIHTFDRAHRLKHILESEGVSVMLQNVNLTSPSISSGIRVRIHERDLPLALRIIENMEIFAPPHLDADASDTGSHPVLVPIDFTPGAMVAAEAAFRIAAMHGACVHLMHTFIDPTFAAKSAMQLSATLDFEATPDPVDEMATEQEIEKTARESMRDFEEKLREKIKMGVLPAVKFDSEISEGLPEEVVDDYVTTHHPLLVVMGTHSSDDHSRQLLGSVTAEVLDSCRASILTIPDNAGGLFSDNRIRHIVFFSTSTQDDILTLDALYRLLPEAPLSVTIVSMPGAPAADNMLTYCRDHYPAYKFSISPLSLSNPVEDLDKLSAAHSIDLITVGTRKKNIFVRLFSPTLAHKLLFHADIPLLSIPV